MTIGRRRPASGGGVFRKREAFRVDIIPASPDLTHATRLRDAV
jgi:hypothetical protein